MKRKVLLILLTSVGATVAMVLWPRAPDPYGYLRKLRPEESDYAFSLGRHVAPTIGRNFEFSQSYDQVKAVLIANGAKPRIEYSPPGHWSRQLSLTLPTGGFRGREPSWFDRLMLKWRLGQ